MFFPGKSNLSFRRGLIYRHPGATDNLIELKVSNRERSGKLLLFHRLPFLLSSSKHEIHYSRLLIVSYPGKETNHLKLLALSQRHV